MRRREGKMGRGGSRTVVVAAAAAIVVLLAAAYYGLRDGAQKPRAAFAAPEKAAQTATVTVPVPAVPSTESAVEAPGEAATEAAAGEATDELVGEKMTPSPSPEAVADGNSLLWLEGVKAYWAKEDEVLASVAKYEDVKDAMRVKAAEMLKGVDAADTKAIVALAQGEIDAFYDSGSLIEPASYEHGYLARAIMELAVEKDPENFELLTDLKEAIGTTLPIHNSEYHPNDAATEALWPVVEKQKELIFAGRVPPSPEAMLAVFDWCSLVVRKTHDTKAQLEGWQWLVDNADAGGWPKVKPMFEKAVECAKQGTNWGMNLYAYPGGPDMDEYARVMRVNWRGLESRRGSREYREKAVKVWADMDKLTYREGSRVHYGTGK